MEKGNTWSSHVPPVVEGIEGWPSDSFAKSTRVPITSPVRFTLASGRVCTTPSQRQMCVRLIAVCCLEKEKEQVRNELFENEVC